MTIESFNALDENGAAEALLACCASKTWAWQVARRRPFTDPAALVNAAMTAYGDLDATEIAAAVAAHPDIGTKVDGKDRESAWSRGEQRGAQDADSALAAAQTEANFAYRQRFGHVFLICATGLSAEHMLAEARRRLNNDPETEAVEVAEQLRDIVALRVRKLVTA